MEDILFVSVCKHRIQNYKLHIVERDGRYFAKLPTVPVRIPTLIYIRSWEDERNYIAATEDYKDLQSYAFFNSLGNVSVNTPLQGANAKIGFTHYAFTAPDEIEFLKDENDEYEIDTRKGVLPTPVYLIDFTADPKYCPRCMGTSVVKDVFIDDTGKGRIITGKEKIKQQVIKALITPVGWDVADPEYGSELSSLVGRVVTDDVRIIMQTTIMNCVNHLINNQPPTYTDEETIRGLDGITIEELGNGNDAFAVKVIVTNALGEKIDCSVAFNLE